MLKSRIGLIIGVLFAIFDGTLGIIELIVVIIVAEIIRKIFRGIIAEAITEIYSLGNAAHRLNNWLNKNEKSNSLFGTIIDATTGAWASVQQENFNRKMNLWINISEFIIFIITMFIAIKFDL